MELRFATQSSSGLRSRPACDRHRLPLVHDDATGTVDLMPSSITDQGRADGEIPIRMARSTSWRGGHERASRRSRWVLAWAALPVSVPLLVAVKVLAAPGRVVAATMTDGAVPLVGPSIARTLDRIQGYATPERSPGAASLSSATESRSKVPLRASPLASRGCARDGFEVPSGRHAVGGSDARPYAYEAESRPLAASPSPFTTAHHPLRHRSPCLSPSSLD